MRTIIFILVLISSVTGKSQMPFSGGFMNYYQQAVFGNTVHSLEKNPGKKWFLSSYSGLTTGFSFYNGGTAMMVGVPVGIQLNRQITNNWYAFAGVSVMPTYLNFNRSFLSSDVHNLYPNNGLFRSNTYDIYARTEMGLMYINDARTFSISGSIGVERSSYPMIPYPQQNNSKPNPATRLNR